MRVLIVEYLTSGLGDVVDGNSSLLREGRAMVEALLHDARALPGVTPVTIWDRRLAPPECPGLEFRLVDSTTAADGMLLELLHGCDHALIVAPECDAILESLLEFAHAAIGAERVIGPSPETAALCGDKLRLAGELQRWGIPTPPTEALETTDLAALAVPCVVKPRDGAGCEETYRLTGADLTSEFPRPVSELIVQPFISGVPLSNAVIVGSGGRMDAFLPLGRQAIEGERQLRYAGGEIPWRSADAERAGRLAEQCCERLVRELPGLRGWIGCDWVWDPGEGRLWLIEVNPRLTTSYVGYRKSLEINLAGVLLQVSAWPARPSIREGVRFAPDGNVAPLSSENARDGRNRR